MGIPGLFRLITNKYDDTHQPLTQKNEKDNVIAKKSLYIDFNPLIYNAFHNVSDKLSQKHKKLNDNIIIKETIYLLDNLIKEVDVNHILYIAIDGTAPFAKIVQQRERRYKKVIRDEIMKHHFSQYNNWDSSQIIPGTIFMQYLALEIRKYLAHINLNIEKIIFSDHHVPGEGEHKILQFLNEKDKEEKENENYIYSNDGDLIILMNRFSYNHTFFLISDVDKSSCDKVQTYSTKYYTINISKFSNYIIDEILVNCEHIQQFGVTKQSILYDFIFFIGLSGNDFIKPIYFSKMRDKHSWNMLIDIYQKLLLKHKNNLINIHHKFFYINNDFFIEFVSLLAHQETHKINILKKNITKSMKQKNKKESKKEKKEENLDHSFFYNIRNPFFNAYKNQYLDLFHCKDDIKTFKKKYNTHFFQDDNMKDIVIDYLKSLCFTIKYYMNELPSWTYFYKYHAAPLPSDIVNIIKKFNININDYLTFDKDIPFSPFMQLLLVLPKEKSYFIPKPVNQIMFDKKYKQLYPPINTVHMNALHEHKFIYSEVILKHFSPQNIQDIQKKYLQYKKNIQSFHNKRDKLNFHDSIITLRHHH